MADHSFFKKGFHRISSKEELNQYVSDEEIMYHYFGHFSPGQHYKCPFKHETSPSFQISYYRGELRWTRWGMFDNSSHNAVQYVMHLYGIGWFQALNKIQKEMVIEGKRPDHEEVEKIKENKNKKKAEVKIEFSRQWTEPAMEYWSQYKLDDKKLLLRHNTFPLYRLWIGKQVFHEYTKEEPFYVFLHNEEKEIYTCYKPIIQDDDVPFGRDERFRKQNTKGHVMGFNRCTGGDVCFITSSKKDIMTLDRLRFDSIAPHSESGWKYQEFLNAVMHIKKRYKYVYVAFDNDSTGVHESQELTKQFGLNYWNVPKYAEGKDPSDAVKFHGDEFLLESIKEKFMRDGIFNNIDKSRFI